MEPRLIHFFSISAIGLYSVAVFMFLVEVVGKRFWRGDLAMYFFYAAFLAHAALVFPFLFDNRFQFLQSGGDYFFWLSFALAIAFILFRRRLQYATLGCLWGGMIILFMVSSSYLMHITSLGRFETPVGFLLSFHVLPVLVAEVCFCIAFGVSTVYLLQQRRLKNKQIEAITLRGPSLETLERYRGLAVQTGLIAMTFAIVSGCIWAYAHGDLFLKPDLFVWMALLAWVVLSYIQHGSAVVGWSGKKSSKITVLITAIILLGLVCVRLFSGTIVHGNAGI